MTKLEFINLFFFQWLFFRLARHGNIVDGKFVQSHWGIVYWIWPTTGWYGPYKTLGRYKSKTLFKK